MASQTSALPDGSTLTKPAYTDSADIAVINTNMDKIVSNINAENQAISTLNSKFTIKNKTFNVNTGRSSQVTFDMDNTEQIPIHVKCGINDIFSFTGRTGGRWTFTVGRLALESSVHNGYFYEALFNYDITITVYYIG